MGSAAGEVPVKSLSGNIWVAGYCNRVRGRVSEMFVTSYSVTYSIYIPGKLGFCSYRYCAVYDPVA